MIVQSGDANPWKVPITRLKVGDSIEGVVSAALYETDEQGGFTTCLLWTRDERQLIRLPLIDVDLEKAFTEKNPQPGDVVKVTRRAPSEGESRYVVTVLRPVEMPTEAAAR